MGQTVRGVSGRSLDVAGHRVTSFVSASYLGLEQEPRVLDAVGRAIGRFGTALAIPRLLAADPLSRRLELRLAELVGQERALLFPSTTHAGLDALPLLAGQGVVAVDAWTYPTQYAGLERAGRQGAAIHRFGHDRLEELEVVFRRAGRRSPRVVACDGVYSDGGGFAPLRRLAALARRHGAVLYLDDSHGLALLGRRPRSTEHPYGRGAGGLIRYAGPLPAAAVLVCSLQKALGVPLAFVAGPGPMIRHLAASAEAMIHSSPASVADVAAALAALDTLSREGERRRRHLACLVRHFRAHLADSAIAARSNGLFPIVTVEFDSFAEAVRVGTSLRRGGVWPLVQRSPRDLPASAALRFFVTALHRSAEIERAVALLEASRARAVSTARARS